MVKVSIIMPVYNSEKFLGNALNSIVNQSLKDFELICIDDGSSDDSLNILNDYAGRDSRIKIITQKNGGSGAARNRGLEVCQGDYVFFIDSDDEISLNLLNLTYKNAVSNDSDLVLFKISNIQDDKETFVTPELPYEKVFPNADFDNFTFNCFDVKDYLFKLYYAPWTKLYKREFLSRYDDFLFDEELPYEDVLFHVKAMLRASKLSYVPKYLYHYRIDNSDSVTFNREDHIQIFKIIDMVESFLIDENYMDGLKAEFGYFKLNQVILHMEMPIDESYFDLAKKYLDDIDSDVLDITQPWLKKRFEIFEDCDSHIEYEQNIKVLLLIQEHDKLKSINKKLKSQLKRQKKIKKELTSSNSWKYTKSFRKIFNKF